MALIISMICTVYDFLTGNVMQTIVGSASTVLLQLCQGTWSAMTFAIKVIAVFFAGICNTLVQIMWWQLAPLVTIPSVLPDKPSILAVFTRVVFSSTFVVGLLILIYYATKHIWHFAVTWINRKNQGNRRERGIGPEGRRGKDIGQQRREEIYVELDKRLAKLINRQLGTKLNKDGEIVDISDEWNHLIATQKTNRKGLGRRHGLMTTPLVPDDSSTRRRKTKSLEEIDKSKLKRLEEELAKEMESKLCVVCLDNPRKLIIKPCNHYCLCEQCRKHLISCPICTGRIRAVEKIYNS